MAFSDARRERGLYLADVVESRRVSPHVVRVTLEGDDLRRLPCRGFDHWVRLFVPHPGGDTRFDDLPETFGVGGFLKYLTAKSGTRPVVRSYTLREHDPATGRVEIDFIVHSTDGVAGPWAARAEPGERVAMIDQGCGFDQHPDTQHTVLVGDESALPAIRGILRDLPADASGDAIIEVPQAEDEQELARPAGVTLTWLHRADPGLTPGELALEALRSLTLPVPLDRVAAFVVGEQRLAAEGRRHLVALGVPKGRIEFTGFWRKGKPAM